MKKENDFCIEASDSKDTFQGYFTNANYENKDLYIVTGKQTAITEEIKNIAANFNDNKDISTIVIRYIKIKWFLKF